MPFADATALVTVEREGVIASSVIHLSGHNPIITLPVRDYAPNVFVSVLAIRGRIGSIQPTGMLDLGKPAFSLGIAEIRVGWRANRLKVAVKPDRTRVPRARECARQNCGPDRNRRRRRPRAAKSLSPRSTRDCSS